MVCGACNKPTKGKNNTEDGASLITCSKCSTIYHILCLNMKREDHKELRTKQTQFVCPSCKLKTKNVNTDNTPIRPKQSRPEDDLTGPDFMLSTQKLATMDVPGQILCSFTEAVGELKGIFMAMKNEMEDFTRSLNATTDDIAQFRQELCEVKTQMRELDKYKTEVISLRAEVAELRRGMALEEQRRFLRDVEITGVTENKSENLPQLVGVISASLGVELDPRDVDDVRRVGPRGNAGALEQPRPIVVTLTRRAPRDQLLRAARSRRGLTTEKLQVAGNPRRVFLNEHLTKDNRILFSKARRLGHDLRFKYVWSSNGNIFMRRSDTSSVLRVSSEAVLEKLTIQNGTPQEPQNCS